MEFAVTVALVERFRIGMRLMRELGDKPTSGPTIEWHRRANAIIRQYGDHVGDRAILGPYSCSRTDPPA